MDYINILYAAAALGGLALLFGVGLGFAAIKFAVEVDPLVPVVRELLPGANCGGCGFAGCDAFANALVSGAARPNGCPVNNSDNASKIAIALGQVAVVGEKTSAFVKCNGTCDLASEKYEYYGIKDCQAATYLQGTGSKGCEYGCLGLGSCFNVCMFDAITIENGIAIIDEDKCVSCGLCVNACPKNIIEIVKVSGHTRVKCNSKDKGKEVKANCSVGCIGCGICVKQCESDAIHVNDSLAKIDYDKCINCGKCVAKCPTKAIIS
ncbi:MAG: ferredoxin [Firmicutes bacterium HGW-Firmicutes-1]|nr:MAG: ferredoxin [Firmicutes bacterium HGW-Firmicutes-1]